MAAPDIDKSSSVPLDRTVCIADKELAGREGAGRRRRSAHLRGQWETETANRYEQLDQFESIGEILIEGKAAKPNNGKSFSVLRSRLSWQAVKKLAGRALTGSASDPFSRRSADAEGHSAPLAAFAAGWCAHHSRPALGRGGGRLRCYPANLLHHGRRSAARASSRSARCDREQLKPGPRAQKEQEQAKP